jgi:hypothetical protein
MLEDEAHTVWCGAEVLLHELGVECECRLPDLL